MTRKQRDELLAEMTDEVAALVLRDSYTQTQALGLATSQAAGMLDVHARLIRSLEQTGGLDRALEFLPGRRRARRARAARPRPDLARAGGAAGLRQDRSALGAARVGPAGGAVPRRRAAPLLPGAAARALRGPSSRAIRCDARSSPPT